MSDPLKFSLSHLEWHIFRVNGFAFRDLKGHMIGHELPNDLKVWLYNHIRGKWSVGQSFNRPIHIYIQDKQDAILFKLTWLDITEKVVFHG